MSFIGQSPRAKRIKLSERLGLAPQSADPASPVEGDIFYSDGTPRPEGLYVYTDGAWSAFGSTVAAIPAGVVNSYVGTSAPTGWLLCNGAAVSRTTFAGLFSVIGTSFGSGDGSTTFNVPDMRGRFVRGVDSGAGRDPDASSRTASASGGSTGDNVGSLQGHAFQTHTHTQNPHNHDFQFASPGGGGGGGDVRLIVPPNTTTSTAVLNTTATNQNASASGANSQASANETRPVNLNFNFIVKV